MGKINTKLKSEFYSNISYAYDELAKNKNEIDFKKATKFYEDAKIIHEMFCKNNAIISGSTGNLNQLEKEIKLMEITQ